MLIQGKRGGTYWYSTVLNEEVLHDNRTNNDAQEQEVVEESGEDVVLLESKLSGVDFVEDLHKDKGVEDQSVVLSLLGSSKCAIDWVNDEEGKIWVVGVIEEASSTE